MLPQSAAVAFVLTKVAVNGVVMECNPVVFMQVGAHLLGAEFAADKGVDVLDQLRIELIGFAPVLFGQPALPLGFSGIGIGYGIVRLGSVVCSSWQSFLQERPYATAYWPFSVMESCTSNANPPALTKLRNIELNQK